MFGDGDPNQGIEEERWKLVIFEHSTQWSVAFNILYKLSGCCVCVCFSVSNSKKSILEGIFLI